MKLKLGKISSKIIPVTYYFSTKTKPGKKTVRRIKIGKSQYSFYKKFFYKKISKLI